MKIIILTITAVAISISAFAQTDSSNNRMNQNDINTQQTRKSHPDGYVMQNGKVMMSKNGKMTTMEKEMTFSDGSVLMSDGTILRKDGTKLMIKDGEYVDMTGKVVRSDRNKDMYLVPDSTKNKK